MAVTQNISRISVRYRPSGELRVSLKPLRPMAKPKERSLVYSCEVQDFATRPDKRRLRSGFGKLPNPTSFGKLGKERVRDGCAILDQKFGHKCLFLTGTLPGSTDRACKTLAEWSGYVVSRIKQWLRDNAQGSRTVWVWELQKRGALHLHAVVAVNDTVTMWKLQVSWQDLWCHVLEEVTRKAGVDICERAGGGTWAGQTHVIRADAQYVEKSVGRYLSKYVSKGSGKVTEECKYYPSRWWGMDAWVKSEVVLNTVVRVFRPAPYVEALRQYMILITGLSLDAEQFYSWRNKFDAFQRTFVCWLQDERSQSTA